jgi:hypothetical protein
MNLPASPHPIAWLIPLLALLLLSALGRLLWGRRAAALPGIEAPLAYALIGAVAVSWIGTLLAAMGLFRPWALGAALAVAIGVRWGMTWRRARPARPVATLPTAPAEAAAEAVAFALLLLGLAWLLGRPAETFRVTDDATLYTLGGIALGRTGGLWLGAEALAPWGHALARDFYTHNVSGLLTRYFGSFYPWGQSGALELGFYPLPKVWPALASWLLGPGGAPWSAPVGALLGALALWGLGRRTLGRAGGLLTLALWGVSLPAIWFGRQPLSENWALALGLGGLYLASWARTASPDEASLHEARLVAACSGASLGALTLIRLEAPFMLAPLALLLWLGWRGVVEPSVRRAWGWALLASGGLGLTIAAGVSRFYLFDATLGTLSPRATGALLAVATVGAAAAWIAHRRGWLAALLPLATAWVRPERLARLVWVAWALLAVVLLIARPLGQTLPGWLIQYGEPLGVILAVVGAALLLGAGGARPQPEVVALLGSAGLLALVYTARPMIVPVHPWAMRRLLPQVLPALTLGLAAAPLTLSQRLRARALPTDRLATAPGWLLGIALVLMAARPGLFLWQHAERGGEWASLAALHAHLPADACLLVEGADTALGLPQPLLYIWGHPTLSLPLDGAGAPPAATDHAVWVAVEAGRPVYLLLTEGRLRWFPDAWRFEPVAAVPASWPILAQPNGRPPTAADIFTQTLTLDLYRITSALGAEAAPALDGCQPVGAGAYAALRGGFYPAESAADGAAFRWTDGDATIALPWPEGESFEIVAHLAGARLEGAAPAELTVVAEGETLYTATLEPSFAPQPLRLSVEGLENIGAPELELRLLSTTFNPDGGRPLGVMVYCVGTAPAR